MNVNIARLESLFIEMNHIGESADRGITRLAYSEEHWAANDYFIRKSRELGMSVRIDAAGNVIARREGTEIGLSAIACGSHLDTVYQGGRFDGTLGVIAGLELVASLNERGIATCRPIEVISFACEESARFGVSTIGSKAMAGLIDPGLLVQLEDKEGISFSAALSSVGLELRRITEARRSKGELAAFFELHIEQGPVLERRKLDVGIAVGIAAPVRLELTIQGKASHSGTTPMNMRHDALIGAAEIILEVERAALAEREHGTVATAGVCDVHPGAMNVVPDWVSLKIDVRGTIAESRQAVVDRIYAMIRQLERIRGLMIDTRILSDEEPVLLDDRLVRSLSEQCDELGVSYLTMMSGAGHDAMNMAVLCPTGLIFVPSRGGLSHHKDEFSSMDQVAKGAAILEQAVLLYAEPVSGDVPGMNMGGGKTYESGQAKDIV